MLWGTLLGAIRHRALFLGMMIWIWACLEKTMKNFWKFAKTNYQAMTCLRIHDDNLGNTSIMDTSLQIEFGGVVCSPLSMCFL